MANDKRVKNTIIFKEDILKILYGKNVDENAQLKRYENLYEEFEKKFQVAPTDFVSASGRCEVCGNHTDHNNGKVLVAAITCDTLAACKKTDDGIVVVSSIGYPDIVVNANDTPQNNSEYGTSLALVKGVIQDLKNRGYGVGGAKLKVTSDVFKGAGVSSSASFELLITEVMNIYYNSEKIPPIEKAQISQYAENFYFGKPCGLLDQAGIALGSLSTIDFEDSTKCKSEVINFDFGDYSLVITNTGGDHSNLTGEYASIREEMQNTAKYFGKKVLREVDEETFYSDINGVRASVNDRAVLRAKHFYDENRRVERAVFALKNNDIFKFFEQISKSGKSSMELLQNCYVPASVAQPIMVAIAVSKKIIRDKGAVRVHGGGFAGTILAFTPKRLLETYTLEMRKIFGDENVFVSGVRLVGSCKVNK